MSKTVNNVMKGIGAGMAAGIAVGVLSSAMMSSKRRVRKNGRRAKRQPSVVEDAVSLCEVAAQRILIRGRHMREG